jgi:hypothetical protein
MRIVAYVGVVVGWLVALALGLVWWAVDWWLGATWYLTCAVVALTALAATSPTRWGEHGRKGPRARQDGRRGPNGAHPTRYPRQ